MLVERVKYVVWAVDTERATAFYCNVFGGRILRQNSAIVEVGIHESIIGIHSGGEGNQTWTGMSFQIADVIEGAQEVLAAGGQLTNEPKPENGEPPHLAMCVDTEGNQFMLTRKRSNERAK